METVPSVKDRELWAKDWGKALNLYPSERALLLYLASQVSRVRLVLCLISHP